MCAALLSLWLVRLGDAGQGLTTRAGNRILGRSSCWGGAWHVPQGLRAHCDVARLTGAQGEFVCLSLCVFVSIPELAGGSAELTAICDDNLLGWLPAPGAQGLDLLHHLHALLDTPEHHMFAVQPGEGAETTLHHGPASTAQETLRASTLGRSPLGSSVTGPFPYLWTCPCSSTEGQTGPWSLLPSKDGWSE